MVPVRPDSESLRRVLRRDRKSGPEEVTEGPSRTLNQSSFHSRESRVWGGCDWIVTGRTGRREGRGTPDCGEDVGTSRTRHRFYTKVVIRNPSEGLEGRGYPPLPVIWKDIQGTSGVGTDKVEPVPLPQSSEVEGRTGESPEPRRKE